MKLIEFLEEDLKVKQQTIFIQEKSDEKRNGKQNSHGRKIDKNGAHFIATVGPRGTEIVQYFAFKKFPKMTPKERFQELRRKRCYFQCLLSGELQSTGKHSDD